MFCSLYKIGCNIYYNHVLHFLHKALLRIIKGHYATTLRFCASAAYETNLLYLKDWARLSHSAVQRRQYYRANCQHTARGGGGEQSRASWDA